MGFDWKKVIGGAAPMIGTALGGPFGGAAAKMLVDRLGLTKNGAAVDAANSDDLQSAFADAMMKPEQVAQLKLAELDFQKNMAELNIKSVQDMEKIAADDRADARNMQVQTRGWVAPSIAVVFVVGFFAVIGLKVAHVITGADPTLSDLFTTLRDGLILILAYYFGSSAGSAAKNDILAQKGDK